MTRNKQTLGRRSRSCFIAACALLASACGSASGESVAASADASAAVEQDPVPSVKPDEPSGQAAAESSEAVDAAIDETQPVPDPSAIGIPVSSKTTFRWIPHCSMGPPLSAEPADCEIFGGYTLLRATLSGDRTGTFEGTESLHATFAVAPDGRYVLGGISSFVGTVAECGEGTLVYNTAGWGSFDLEQSAEIGSPVLDGTTAISYNPTSSELNTIDVVIDTEMTTTAPNTLEVTGIVSCHSDSDSNGVTRPDSGVDEVDSLELSGSGTFTFRTNCTLTQGPTANPPCEIVNGFKIQPLLNSLTFSGSLEGDARFIATNLLALDTAEYEHSGILVFEGTVEGCGDGVILMVNESAGNGLQAGWSHLRAFTPPEFELGPLGVYVDITGSLAGFASANLEGNYSCLTEAESP